MSTNKVLDASKETQMLTTESRYNNPDYRAEKLVLREPESITYNNFVSDDIELCLNKSKTNLNGSAIFNESVASNCLKKLLNTYSNNY
jgi:hypothetical protein